MNFDTELENGNFIVAECKHCQKIVWPPSDFCNKCFRDVSWRKGADEGKIIEFSRKNDSYFCLIEIEKNIRIIGKLSRGIPVEGQQVKIEKCGIENKNHSFEISLL